MKKYILAILLIINDIYAVDFTDPTKPIIVDSSSQSFSVILQSNPSTGYSWLLKSFSKNLISPVNHKFYPSKEKLNGAPGYEKWTFNVKPLGFIVPQIASISFIYARPWDTQNAKITNFEVITKNDN